MSIQIGYCTNVHAGADLAQTQANLERYAVAVKQRFSPTEPMGLGLWLSASAAQQLRAEKRIPELRDWLAERGLVPFTLNGFPYGDFHQRVVKHQVYHPTWWHPDRLRYTLDLIAILHGILPAGLDGSISTLPVAWAHPEPTREEWQTAARALLEVADHLELLEAETGRLIYLCLEPEPGCLLQRSADVERFFSRFLFGQHNHAAVHRHLRVCHDICHQAIMFEEQDEVFHRYRDAGVRVGKIQVSAAVSLPFQRLPCEQHVAAIKQLRNFVEERYLHQTVQGPGEITFYEDLPLALEWAAAHAPTREWRVHFHVPIYLERFGLLETTQFAIRDCLHAVGKSSACTHFEAETYAWDVLPPELQQPDLAAGIAEEMKWLATVAHSRTD